MCGIDECDRGELLTLMRLTGDETGLCAPCHRAYDLGRRAA